MRIIQPHCSGLLLHLSVMRLAFILLFAIVGKSSANSNEFEFRTIALDSTSGLYGPGAGFERTFAGFQDVLLSESGTVVFSSNLVSFGEVEGLWINQGHSNSAVAFADDYGALGPNLGPSLAFDRLVRIYPADNDEFAFNASLKGEGVNNDNESVVVRHIGGMNQVLARSGVSGEVGPGIPGAFFQYLKAPLLYPNGDLLLGSTLTGPSVDDANRIGVWKYTKDGQQLIFRTGSVGPLGAGIGVESFFVDEISSFPPQIASNTGDVVLAARAKKSEISPLEFGLWRNLDGVNIPFMLSGEDGSLGPGLGSGLSFDVGTVAFPAGLNFDTNSNGDVLFSSDLNDGRNGFWRNVGNINTALALTDETGALGPGLGPSYAFSDLTSNFRAVPTINDNGVSLFKGTLKDTNQEGLWINDGVANRAIALTGKNDELGPDLGTDTVFSGFNRAVINNNDTVFFTANLSPGVPSNRLLGLWAYKNDEITKLASVGELFDVDPTEEVDERVIRWVQIPYEQQVDSNGATINDRDEVVVRIAFEDGTQGIFVASLVPEPTALLLSSLGSMIILSLRCRV